MDPASQEMLTEIGRQLDANVFPQVFGNGVVSQLAERSVNLAAKHA